MTSENFGRYVIKEVVGRGGMATVYLAHDPRFGRDVALKVMSQAFQADPTFRGRFEREARTIATLEHPAIVPVYDFGEDHDQLYLVMRYMPGGSLAERIIQGPMSLEDALPIIRPIASALDHAHKRGIIHRDLKPGNILFDEYGNAFLSDFGIVKVSEATASLTGSGVIGTPAYMSPEQVHGDDAIDGRSDIYTLGIILFEMLTSRKPFRADTPVKLMMSHVLNPVPSILEERPDLPPAFDTIIQKTLSKKPEERFANGQALTEALTMTLTNITKLPLPPSIKTAVPNIADLPTAVFDGPTEIIAGNDESVENVVAESVEVTSRKRPWRWQWIAGALSLVAAAAFLFTNYGGNNFNVTPTAEATATNQAIALQEPTLASSATATTTSTPTVTLTPQPTPTGTIIPTQTPTALPTPARQIIANSLEDNAIEAIGFGSGENVVVLVGGLHAGFAPASVTVAEQTIEYLTQHPEEIPDNVQIFVIANANPDSTLSPGNLNGRLNARGVDLNRNWDCRWEQDTQISGRLVPGAGGTAPFSEPEIAGLSEFLLAQEPVAVVFWEARVTEGLVSPGSCGDTPKASQALAEVYGEVVDYNVRDFEALTQQVVNGDSTNWLDDQEIPAISVLLPEYDELLDWEANLAAVLAVMNFAAAEQTE